MSLEGFLKAAGAIVDAGNVISDPAALAPFGRIMVPVPEEKHMPGGVVSPKSVEEIQALLRVAGEHKVALWPTSTGRNFGYGTSSTATPGQVLLDMRRMNKILEVDPVLCTALVEPGVTYQQLQDHLKAEGHDLWLDFPAPGPLVSPLGNTLERGGGMTPYGDHFANSCGYEVVLADGTILRTGLGGVKNTTSWQAFRYGYGPFLDGIFTQSNFGIVTKMGMWLMPAPEAHRTGMAVWDKWEDVGPLIDALRPLRFDGTIGNFGLLGNATLILSAMMKRADVYAGTGAVPHEIAAKVAKEKGLGTWMYMFSVYGRPERVASDWAVIEKAITKSGGRLIPDIHDPMQVNELSLSSFATLNWVGGHGLAWFSPVVPLRAKDVQRQMDLAHDIMTKHGVDFMTGLTLNGREGLNVMPLLYDRNDEDSMRRHKACYDELISAFENAGFGFYRTPIGFMDRMAELHGSVNLDVNRRIKRALDPQGIIAPGKSGIFV